MLNIKSNNMKTKVSILKLSVLIFILTGIYSSASAQLITNNVSSFGNTAMVDASQVICKGKEVRLSVPTPAADIEYKWLTRHPSADGITAGTGEPLATNTGNLTDAAANITNSGYYIYKLEVTNTTTNCAEVYEQLVYILPTPVVTIAAPDLAACASSTENITLTASAATSPDVTQTFEVTYQWYSQKQGDASATLIPTATSNTYTVATPTGSSALGSYDYHVKVTYKIKDCGETSSEIKTIVITTPSKPTITIASN